MESMSAKPTCNEVKCEEEATYQGPAEGGATPNPPIVGRCGEHANAPDKKL